MSNNTSMDQSVEIEEEEFHDAGISIIPTEHDYPIIVPNHLVIGPMISEGHYSIVYSGEYMSKSVAIKTIMPDNPAAVSPDRRAKFAQEVVMLSKVNHDNIVKFIGASMEPTMLIVTELMEGGKLQKYLWSIRPNILDLKLAIKFALDICSAMEYLHSISIIHRDLKPANLLLTKDQKKIKVADFGLAREQTEMEKTIEAGTYRWMAPELINVEGLKKGEKKYYDHKVDIYSFSMVLWELLVNETPFKGKHAMLVAYAVANKVRPSLDNIPKDFLPLLESCWSEDPAKRPEFREIRLFLEKIYRNLSPEEDEKPTTITVAPKEHVAEQDKCEVSEAAQGNKRKTGGRILRCLSCSYD